MNWYTYRGSNSSVFNFASLVIRGQLLKARICSFQSRFFPFRDDPHFVKVSSLREANRKLQSCSPWKNGEKTWRCTHGYTTLRQTTLRLLRHLVEKALSKCHFVECPLRRNRFSSNTFDEIFYVHLAAILYLLIL